VDSLPSNFVVMKWMEEQRDQPKNKPTEPKCDNCEEKLAVLWCEPCSQGTHYCSDCDASVHVIKALRNHVRITLKEKKKKLIFIKCKSHAKDNKVYCVDCKVLICNMCFIDDHPQHKTMSIYKYGDILKNEMKKEILDLNLLIVKLTKLELDIGNEMKKNEAERAQLQEKITQLQEKVTIVDSKLKENKIEEENIRNLKRKVETSNIVITKSIEEIGIMDLMNKDIIETMKKKNKKY